MSGRSGRDLGGLAEADARKLALDLFNLCAGDSNKPVSLHIVVAALADTLGGVLAHVRSEHDVEAMRELFRLRLAASLADARAFLAAEENGQ